MNKEEHDALLSKIYKDNEESIRSIDGQIKERGTEFEEGLPSYSNYYDRMGNSISVAQWRILCNYDDYKIVKQDTIEKYLISTVWLGLNFGFLFFKDARIQIFETMIFDNEAKPWNDIYSNRYYSEKKALEGHQGAIEWLKASGLLKDSLLEKK